MTAPGELSDEEVFGAAPAPAPAGPGVEVDIDKGFERLPDGSTHTLEPPPAPPAAAPAEPHSNFGLGFMSGVNHVLDRGATGLEDALKALGLPTDAINHALGMPSSHEVEARHATELADAKAHGEEPSWIGQAAGTTLATLPALFESAGVGGAIQGVATGDAHDLPGILKEAAFGAIGGKVGEGVVKGVAGAVAPKLSEAAAKLLGEGVPLTPGQIIGGVGKRIEDGMSSVPFVGDIIRNAQRESILGFNRAATNRALAPIGESLPADIKPGHDAVAYAGDRLSAAYDALMPHLNVTLDPEYASAMSNLRTLAANLPEDQAGVFDKTLKQEIASGFAPQTGTMSGETLKRTESVLTAKIKRYGSSPNPHDQDLADALGEARDQLRQLLMRTNPDAAPALKALNTGWANLARVEAAAGRVGSKDGVFTSGSLAGSVRQADSSVRKRAVARGNALMQDLSKAGDAVLPSSVPDSGTALRSMFTLGGPAMAGGAMMHMDPAHMLLAGTGAAALATPYTATGRKAAELLLAKRPAAAAKAAELLSRAKRPAAQAGGVLGGRIADNF